MISPLEKEITLRFLRARKKDGFLNVISIFSFIGIGLGVAVLIIVMSVMNGFRSELINKIVGFNAHITVDPYENKIIKDNIDQKLISISKDIILSNSGESIIIKGSISKGILLRGYNRDDFSKLEIFSNKNYIGNNKILSKNQISIGKELSFTLDLNVGDTVTLMSSAGVKTIIGNLPKQKTFLVSSIFESGMVEFDNNIAFINLETLEEFLDLNEVDRKLEIYLKNPQNIQNQKTVVQNIFPNDFVYSWSDMNSSLFSALKVERNVMFIILSLIIIVAAFNIISGLTILVKNKTRDIAILKSIGVLNKSIVFNWHNYRNISNNFWNYSWSNILDVCGELKTIFKFYFQHQFIPRGNLFFKYYAIRVKFIFYIYHFIMFYFYNDHCLYFSCFKGSKT